MKLVMREQMKLLMPLFILIVAIWLLRIIAGATDTFDWLARLLSLTTITPIVTLMAVFLIHSRRSGSYSNVVIASLLLNTLAQGLIIAAVLFAVFTNTENIYTAPEFSMPGDDPHHLRHIYGHLTFGIGLGTIVCAAVGCLLLWLLRELIPARPPSGAKRTN